MIDKEDNHHSLLDEEDGWGGDIYEETDELPNPTGVLQPAGNVLYDKDDRRGTSEVRHRFLTTLCKNVLRTVVCGGVEDQGILPSLGVQPTFPQLNGVS